MTGTAAQVSTDLDALVFTPTLHQVPPGQTVPTNFTIHVQDTPLGQTATDTMTSVVATAVAAPVTIGGTQGNQAVFDNATINPFKSVTITDPNAGQNETVTISFTAANGTFTDPNAASATP